MGNGNYIKFRMPIIDGKGAMRKKRFGVILLLLALLSAGYGGDMRSLGRGIWNPPWAPLQIAIGPSYPLQLFGSQTNICGVSLGIIDCSRSFGLKIAGAGVNETLYGIQVSLVSGTVVNRGANLTIHSEGGCNQALQLGICNSLNDNRGLVFGAVNVLRNDNSGVMLGLFNRHRGQPRTEKQKIEIPPDHIDGNFLQLGLVNIAQSGLQIGLWNYNPNAAVPHLPFFNYSEAGPPETIPAAAPR